MIGIETFRDNPEKIKKSEEKRGNDLSRVDEIIKYDKKWRENLQKLNDLRSKRNEMDQEIAELKKKGEDAEEKIKEMKEMSGKISKLEGKVKNLKKKRDNLRSKIGAVLEPEVPEGKGEEDNIEIKRWGEPPEFDFEPKTHKEILEPSEMLDMERGSKVAGSDFYFLRKDLVNLELALKNFSVDFLQKRGFEPIEPPYIVNKKVYEAMAGDAEDFSEASYKIEGKEKWLIPTAEYPLGGLYMEETLLKDELPKKLCGISPSFRREGGSHGKFSKGIYRVHQFNKVEQFVLCLPEESWDYFEKLQENAEKLYQKLGLHYRVVNCCTGDIGKKASKKYDIECWMADGNFHETGSNSNCLGYQTRELDIKYREGEGKPPEGHLHAVNNTALAMSRTKIAIVEQFQQEDGRVRIPEVLRPYMNGKKFLGSK